MQDQTNINFQIGCNLKSQKNMASNHKLLSMKLEHLIYSAVLETYQKVGHKMNL